MLLCRSCLRFVAKWSASAQHQYYNSKEVKLNVTRKHRILYFQNCEQLEAGEATPFLKTADMNQNESSKRGLGKGLPLGLSQNNKIDNYTNNFFY